MKFSFFYLALLVMSCGTKISNKAINGLSFTISSNKEVNQNKDFIIDLSFFNNTKSAIRILDKFDPGSVFFIITFTAIADGQIYDPIPGGKVDFYGELKYISIAPKKGYKKRVDFGQILSRYDFTLPEGRYRVKVVYKNQYGQDCIKGQYHSNEIEITMKK